MEEQTMTTTNKIRGTLELECALENSYKQQAEEYINKIFSLQCKVDKAGGDTTISKAVVASVLKSYKRSMQKYYNYKAKAGAVPAYVNAFDELKANADDDTLSILCLSALHALLSVVLTEKPTATTTIISRIARDIAYEVKVDFFRKHMTANRNFFDEQLKKRSMNKKRLYVNATYKREDKAVYLRDYIEPSKESFNIVATVFYRVAVDTLGLFEEHTYQKNQKSREKRLEPTEAFMTAVNKSLDKLTSMAFKFNPMIVPPTNWTSPWGGGYVGVNSKMTSILRVDWDMPNRYVEQYKRRISTIDLSTVYSAVNAIQSTAFNINEKILDVAEAIVKAGGGKAGIASNEELPPVPHDAMIDALDKKDTRREIFIHKLTLRHKAEASRKSRWLRTATTLATARKFSAYDSIYFPWNIDYRGRMYPIPTQLSPQGDDVQKALLLFRRPKQVTDPMCEKWFIIEGANRAGIDKVTFDERIKWVDDNKESILKSASNPLSMVDWWGEQDSPFLFLAWCFEYARLVNYKAQHSGSILGWSTGISCNYDGTCSGLQHFSMLLRDEIGGKAVNLVPQDTVSDIYGIVASKVQPILERDAISGTDDGPKVDKKTGEVIMNPDTNEPIIKRGTKTLALQWLEFAKRKYGSPRITRKTVKRCVMTFAYGSGRYGFAEQLVDDIIDPFEATCLEEGTSVFLSKKQASVYLAELIMDAVKETVVKAYEGMHYLTRLGKMCAKDGHVVQWTTPNGLLVQQSMFKHNYKIVKLTFGALRERVYTDDSTKKLSVDSKAQAQALPPNFIHSLDATHMQRVVNHMHKDTETNFFMIHDSFGCDLSYAPHLYKVIREELVKLYDNQDWLKVFTEQIRYKIGEKKKLPTQPDFGQLDIKKITESKYCFA